MFWPAPGAIVGGKYRLERPLAQGGMGSIWVAWQTGLERPVAIKFMSRELGSSGLARARFDREARAAAQLRTPHVVQMFDHGIEDDTPFIAMELLYGEDLNGRLRREKRLPLFDVAQIAMQIAKALRRAEEAGIVHRDLKPANVFVAKDGDEEIVKVLDFGIARLAEAEGAPVQSESTRSDALVGSPHYMSPEQARGLGQLDHRSDLWAFGVILFRLTTGELPFPGKELGDVIIRVWNDPIPIPSQIAPDLPPELDAFFHRALAKEREDRFQSATDMALAFASAAGVAAHLPRTRSASGEDITPAFSSGPYLASKGPPLPNAAGASEYAMRSSRPDTAGGTLGGSHKPAPRPAHVPVIVWTLGALGLFALGAAALIFALRPAAPAAGADLPPRATASPSETGPKGESGAPSPEPTSSAQLASSSEPIPAEAPSAAAPGDPAAAPQASTSASAAASAKSPTVRPKGPRRPGHDFGY